MSDEALAQIVATPATDIPEAIAVMEQIDGALADADGLKWFNLLYLIVTRAVLASPPAAGWQDPAWLTRLDVVFANLYFGAVASWLQDHDSAPRAWQALFEARFRPNVMRVQFALCGMNAHINHDLPLAVVRTGEELHVEPVRGTPQHQDFEHVNDVLAIAEPTAIQFLATGLLGRITQDLGTLDDTLAIWSVRRARDSAWTNAEILWALRAIPVLRSKFLRVLDRTTGFAGRGLLLPVAPHP
jgi:hypothetical protein